MAGDVGGGKAPDQFLAAFEVHQPPALAAGGEVILALFPCPVDEHPAVLPHAGGVAALGDLVGQGREAVVAVLDLRPGGVVRHGGGPGARPGGLD